jgi:Ca-activated chloride channel family protein
MNSVSRSLRVAVGGALVCLAACGSYAVNSSMNAGGAGARAGGAQDIGLARAQLDAGIVPDPEDFPLEGLYAEHDLPLDGAPCTDVLCVRAAAAVAPGPLTDAGSPDVAWVQLGLASNVDLSTFHRRPQNLALVIDTSCSMDGEKIDAVKAAAEKLVDQLDEGDLLTVVNFDTDSHTLIGPRAVTDKEPFKAKLRGLSANNSTCIECGLRDGFTALGKNLDDTRAARVLLLTDEQPNVGSTATGSFIQLLQEHEAQGMAVSLFGVGLDFGQEAATQISSVRGANYSFLETPEKMRTVFDQDFDLLVTPIAYDLRLALTPGAGVTAQAVYGVPGATSPTVDAQVSTVFLSRTHGALVAQLSVPGQGAPIAEASLSFMGADGQGRRLTLDASAPAQASPAYQGAGIRRAVTLTRFGLGARLACARAAAQDRAGALAAATATVALVSDEVAATSDPELTEVLGLAQRLRALLSAR